MYGFLVRPRNCVAATALLCAVVACPSPAFAHGDHGGGGGAVLPQGTTLVTVEYDFVSYRPISDARLTALAADGVAEVHSLKSIAVPSLSVAYGLTRDFTIAARLPYLANQEIRETDVTGPGVNPRGGVFGFGDVSITGTYRIVNDPLNGFEAALIAGFKAPTGRTDVLDRNGDLFETEHQPGSGSWDLILGAALSKQIGPTTLSANALYTFAGDGSQDTRLGYRLSYGIAASYWLWSSGGDHDHPMKLGNDFDGMMRHGGVDHAAESTNNGLSKALDVSLGLNGQWSDKQKVAGERDDNTGGSVIYLTPGIKLTVDKWAGFVNIGVPVVRDFNGIQSEPRLQVTTGLSVRF
jgi:Putative MetA-pathway of phenol degradation